MSVGQNGTESERADEKEPNLLRWLGGILMIAGLIWGGGGWWLIERSGLTIEHAGQSADAMGVTNGLFTAVAVGLVALSIYFQTKELRAQREQLSLQREELKLTRKEMQHSVEEQKHAAEALAKQVEVSQQQLEAQLHALKQAGKSLEQSLQGIQVAEKQLAISQRSANVSAKASVISVLIDSCPDRGIVRAEYQRLLTMKQGELDEAFRIIPTIQGMERRAATMLYQFELQAGWPDTSKPHPKQVS